MCGRFVLKASPAQIAMRFNVQEALVGEAWERYNIAPTQPVLAVAANGSRRTEALRWGLIPSWSRESSIGSKLINARAETLMEKPTFNRLLARRRCLIPASAYYEWKRDGKSKQPMLIRRKDAELIAFAGLWDEWRSPEWSPLRSCTIITTAPNALMADIHDRMPAILCRDDEAAWLDASINGTDAVTLLRPYHAADLEAYPVSGRVNSPSADDAHLVTPLLR